MTGPTRDTAQKGERAEWVRFDQVASRRYFTAYEIGRNKSTE